MKRSACTLILAAFTLAALVGCSSKPPASEAKKADIKLDKIQGKAQVMDPDGSTDAALNPGQTSTYLWEGTNRYRLFMRTAADVVHGSEYVAEGINAQKAIEEIGDPDQGRNGYPLPSSCQRVIKMAWSNMAFDAAEAHAAALCGRIKRYPARTVFLVTSIRPATPEEISAVSEKAKKQETAKGKSAPEITVPAQKQSALLVEGSATQTAPLFQPAGGKVSCKVTIDTEGKISELGSGTQLCEAVQWSQFRYKPAMQGGKPVNVNTEVEITFEPRK